MAERCACGMTCTLQQEPPSFRGVLRRRLFLMPALSLSCVCVCVCCVPWSACVSWTAVDHDKTFLFLDVVTIGMTGLCLLITFHKSFFRYKHLVLTIEIV